MGAFIIGILGCIAAGVAAINRGRTGWWWLCGWIGFIVVIILPPLSEN